MIFAMLPGLLFALFERHVQPLEVVIQQMIQCCFIRPKERPYQTNNAYAALVRQYQMEQEVKAIVQKTIHRETEKPKKLTRAQKKEIDAVLRKYKGDGQAPYGTGHYSRMVGHLSGRRMPQ